MRSILCVAAALAFALPATADAEKVVKEQLEKLKGKGGIVTPVKHDSVKKSFPDTEFVAVRYPQFPVARLAPEPLKASNLFAVTKDGKAEHIGDLKELEKRFLGGKFGEDAAARKHLARAWLALAQELFQDGFYAFKIDEDALKEKDGKVSGKVGVAKGGNGDITISMTLQEGVVTQIQSQVGIERGPRPKCHATLLLDDNPLVRAIVEEDLLIMGRPALPYLAEQHAKASPALQKAIERVRQRILAGER